MRSQSPLVRICVILGRSHRPTDRRTLSPTGGANGGCGVHRSSQPAATLRIASRVTRVCAPACHRQSRADRSRGPALTGGAGSRIFARSHGYAPTAATRSQVPPCPGRVALVLEQGLASEGASRQAEDRDGLAERVYKPKWHCMLAPGNRPRGVCRHAGVRAHARRCRRTGRRLPGPDPGRSGLTRGSTWQSSSRPSASCSPWS